jgi:hypothetical protein
VKIDFLLLLPHLLTKPAFPYIEQEHSNQVSLPLIIIGIMPGALK